MKNKVEREVTYTGNQSHGADPQVVEFRYVPTPDAKERLSRAIAILLKSGMKKKKNERRQHKKEAG